MEALTVPGTLDSLTAIGHYVLAVAAAAGLDKKASYRLRLAVDEVATNIITHGYDEAGYEGALDVRADLDEATLTISLEDTGQAYDPAQALAPQDLNAPLDQRQEGGLGLYLTLRGVDKFRYERVGERNRHTFVVYRPNQSST
jgi:anti-sigma regulatory factor (Ser/Thr protein kinase)